MSQASNQICRSAMRSLAIRTSCRCFSHQLNQPDDKIYVGRTSSRVKRARVISLSSSAATTVIAPLITAKKLHLSTMWMAVACGTPISLTYLYTAVVFFMTRTYVTEMYLKSPDVLVIKKYNFFCCQVTQEINPKDIEVPVNVGLLESFRVKGESYLVDDNDIINKDLYECVSGLRNKRTDL